MKKFLSLVLALVMAMSLVTISAGAKDFTDSDKVTYDDAIEVMSELKVIDGYTDGSFRPTAELNRGAAAKIICNMILGPTTASALSASSAPFVDVPADSVFAGYITYCAKEGIINGYADGTFRPTAPLTGYAFMKMLLGALGYDAEVEGYTGANWSVNVAKQAIGIGLDDGNDDFVGTKYVTREEACLYALNTLKATMVKYGQKTTVTVNGAQVVVGGSEASEVGASAKEDNFKDDGKLQFAEKYFTNLKTKPTTDDFMRPASEWKIKNKPVGVYADDADASYTEAVKGKTIYADLGGDSDEVEDVVAYMDGEKVELDADFAIVKKNDEKIGAQGTLTEVFYDADANDGDGKIVIVMVNTYIMQVDGEYDEDEEEITLAYVDGTEEAELDSMVLSADDFAMIADLEDEDYVLVTVADGAVKSIELAKPTTAVVDEHVRDESVTADGTEYKFSWAWADEAKSMNYVVDEEYELYFDFYGNVIFSEGVDEDEVYLFAYEYAKNNHMNKKAKVDVYAYFVDGSEETIGAKKFDGEKLDGTDAAALQREEAMQWVAYAENSDGTYNLTPVDDVYGAVAEGTKITNEDNVMIVTAEGKVRGTKETVFVVVDEDGDVDVYTGIKNVPVLTAGKEAYVAAVCDGQYAEYVFVELGEDGKADGTDESSDIIFFLKFEKDGTDAADNDYYRYKGIVNGKEEKVRTEYGLDFDGMYTDIEYDSETGYVTDAKAINTKKGDAEDDDVDYLDVTDAVVTQKAGVISIKEQANEDAVEKYYMADDATIYVIEDGEVETITAKKLAKTYEEGGLAGTVYGVLVDGEYTALYIVL